MHPWPFLFIVSAWEHRSEQLSCYREDGDDIRENEAIAVEPFGVLWVEGHELVEEDVGDGCHAHRGARMARVGLECGIDLENSSISN